MAIAIQENKYNTEQRQHMMRQEIEQATKQQEEQAKNKEIEQEREHLEMGKLNKQQVTQNATGAADN